MGSVIVPYSSVVWVRRRYINKEFALVNLVVTCGMERWLYGAFRKKIGLICHHKVDTRCRVSSNVGRFVYKLGKIIVGKYVIELATNIICAVTPPPGAVVSIKISYKYRGIRIFVVYYGAKIIKFLYEGLSLLNRLTRSAIKNSQVDSFSPKVQFCDQNVGIKFEIWTMLVTYTIFYVYKDTPVGVVAG